MPSPRRRTTSSLSPGWQSHRIANKRRASARHSSLALDATASDVPQHPLPHPCRAHGSLAAPVHPRPACTNGTARSRSFFPVLSLPHPRLSFSRLRRARRLVLLLLVAPILTLLSDSRIQSDGRGETGTIGRADRDGGTTTLPSTLPSIRSLLSPPPRLLVDAARRSCSSLPRLYDSCLSLNPSWPTLQARFSCCFLSLCTRSLSRSLASVSVVLARRSLPAPPPPPCPVFARFLYTPYLPTKPKPSATTTIVVVTHTRPPGRRTDRAICCYHQLFASLRSRRGGRSLHRCAREGRVGVGGWALTGGGGAERGA